MSMIRRRVVASLLVAAALAIVGCAAEPAVDTEAAGPTDEDVDIVGLIADAGWLSGRWTVDNQLDAVSSEVFIEEVGDEVLTAVFVVDGQEMSVTVDDVVYTGFVVFGDEHFRFEGATTYEEEDGSVTESDMLVDGRRIGEDSWDATTYAQIRSDGEYVYEVTWQQSASRIE